jgi:phytoene dehydrogenase-like protein
MAQSQTTEALDVLIIGGGLAGLTAATYLARAGRSVKLFEKASHLGGRAATQTKNDFHFNLGPHALYRAGEGNKILQELGIRFSGNMPNGSGGFAIANGKKHTLPGGFISLLTTGLLKLPAKFELACYLGSLSSLDTQSLQKTSVADWLSGNVRHTEVRQLFQALFRLTSYTNAPEHQSAGAALRQLQLALEANVTYIDGGWQTLVNGLRDAAETAGVQIETGKRIVTIEPSSNEEKHAYVVHLEDGSQQTAKAVIIAASPDAAASLIQSEALQKWLTMLSQ